MLLACVSLAFRTEERVLHSMAKTSWTAGVIVIAGFIASAAHLGTPANSLYILAGAGRSPLSNEVIALCLFMPFAGALWLYSCFTEKRSSAVVKALSAGLVATGIGFIAMAALAYKADTIITWNTPCAIINFILGSIIGGIFLFRMLAVLARGQEPNRIIRMRKSAIAVGILLLSHIAVMLAQWSQLQTLQGASYYAYELVPFYPAVIAVYAICTIAAILLCKKPTPLKVVGGNAVYVIGLLGVRFAFYMMHMTMGLSV